MIRLFLLLLFSAIISVAQAQYPTVEHYSQLKPHPRLILRSDDVARLKQAVDTSPQMARLDNLFLPVLIERLKSPWRSIRSRVSACFQFRGRCSKGC